MKVQVEGHGSITLIRPEDEEARVWLHENVGEEAMWWGGALVCEPRYVQTLLDGMAGGVE